MFLAANPKKAPRLRLDEEVRDIKEGLRLSQHREKFLLQQEWAVRPKDIRRAVLYERPNIIHFSGHGSGTTGLSFRHNDWIRAIGYYGRWKNDSSASSDKTLIVWDLQTGDIVNILTGHTSTVCAVAISLDGKHVVSTSWDDTVKVWDLQSGEVIASFTGESNLYCCAIAPDGVTIMAGDYSGRVHFLRLELPTSKPSVRESDRLRAKS